MRIRVDKLRCVSSGQCAATSLDLFTQDEDDGTVILLCPEPPPHLERRAREAAMLCPAQAITILD